MNEPMVSRESQPSAKTGPATRNGPLSLSERVQSLRLPERPALPPSWRTLLPWVLCVLLASAAAYLALREPPPGPEPTGETAGDSKDLLSTSFPSGNPEASLPAGALVLRNKGYIVAVHQIQVSPKVSGMVEELYIKEGDVVQKGTVLAVLENIEYQSDYDRSVAQAASAKAHWTELWRFRDQEIGQTKADLDEAVAQRQQLYLDWKRSLGLRGSALAARDYEQAESSYKAMDRRVERLRLVNELMKKGPRDSKIAAAKADWDLAEAEKIKAKWRLDNCVIKAPITGIILTKKAEKGNIVNAAAFNISASLCDMADLADMEVDLAIPERDISHVFPAQRDAKRGLWLRQKCLILAEAFPDRKYEGYVSRIMPMADRGKGSVPTRVKIRIPPEEAGQYLRPDMGAVVRFLNERVETKE